MIPGQSRHILFRLTVGLPAMAAASLAIGAFHEWLGTSGTMMIYLAAVLWAAARHGRVAAASTIVMAALVGNYFYFEPMFGFGLNSVEDVVALGGFLLVAFYTGTLAARVREEVEHRCIQAEIADERSRELELLLSLQQAAQDSAGQTEMVTRAEAILGDVLGPSARIYMIDDGRAAMGRAACEVFPLRTHDKVVGSLVMAASEMGERRRLVQAAADLIGLTIERKDFQSHMEGARVEAETEKLRAALLSSVSHDFRTPLGSIIGAASTMDMLGGDLTPERHRHLVATILQAARRLDRYVANILDLTTIHAGAVRPAMDWCDIEDVIGSALGGLEGRLVEFDVAVRVEPDLPLLRLDHVLIERVLANLLENATKFSAPGSRIEVTAQARDGSVEVVVFNSGSDIAPDSLPHLFERFYRGGSEVTGTGLGLAICKGFMTAHGGDIIAERQPERGGVAFRLRLPCAAAAPTIEEERE